jgi:hypothetical protein
LHGSIKPLAEQGAKSFLFKMPVVGKDFCQPFPPHGLHRNAIRQAVSLVESLPVELQTGAKRLPALGITRTAELVKKSSTTAAAWRRDGAGDDEKTFRYSVNTSSVVTNCEVALSAVSVNASR